MKLILVFNLLLIVLPAWSLDMNQEPAELESKVRKKEYPGGIDEGSLKVQESVPSPLIRYDKKAVQKQVFEDIQKEASSDKQVQ